eukprot:scaffold28185_cov33-Phaeocystis_antarctica.AAC.1
MSPCVDKGEGKIQPDTVRYSQVNQAVHPKVYQVYMHMYIYVYVYVYVCNHLGHGEGGGEAELLSAPGVSVPRVY